MATAGAVSIAGIALGLQYDVLAAGLAGGLWALSYQPPAPVWKRALSAMTASLIAGYLGPVAATVIASVSAKAVPQMTAEMIRLPIAMGIGFLAHQIGPFLLKLFQKKAGEMAP